MRKAAREEQLKKGGEAHFLLTLLHLPSQFFSLIMAQVLTDRFMDAFTLEVEMIPDETNQVNTGFLGFNVVRLASLGEP